MLAGISIGIKSASGKDEQARIRGRVHGENEGEKRSESEIHD